MGFPADWNGSKIKFEIQTDGMVSDIAEWNYYLRKRDSPIFTKQNGILHGDGDNHMMPNGEDIRFTTDEAGFDLIDSQIVKASVERHPAHSKLEINIIVPYVSNLNVTTIYMWWGNPNADFKFKTIDQRDAPKQDDIFTVIITEM